MTVRRRRFAAVLILASLAACSPGDAPVADRRSIVDPSTASPLATPVAVASTAGVRLDSSPPSTSTPPPPPPETLRPRVLFERRVSPMPRSVADRSWEPVVATHPTDPDTIAVAFEHRGPGAACSTNPLIRISHDSGRTWRTTPSSPGARSGRGMGLHAAIAWGLGPRGKTRLYWANMTSPGCGTGRFSMTTAYSDDEGRTWSPLHVERSTLPWVGGFPDITVDRDVRSPNHDTVYAAYNWFGRHGPGFRLLASRDHGRTWTGIEIPPVKLARPARDWWRIAYRLRPAPDGSVYATWYQVDLRRWDRSNIFAKGGGGNVKRLGVGLARIRYDRGTGSLQVGRPRLIATVQETPWTTSATSAPGTDGNIRPDPMWQYGFDVDPEGGLHVAVGGYRTAHGKLPRGSITVGSSADHGKTWSYATVPAATAIGGRRQSSLRPSLVAGPGYILVSMRLLDDVPRDATMGVAFSVSSDGGRTFATPRRVGTTRWLAADLGGVVNGAGLRERAERTADDDVFWAYGDARLARRMPGKTAIFGARIRLTPS